VLSALQRELALGFAARAPRWFLTGGAALAGFHGYGHRTTEDLDLFATASEDPELGERALLETAHSLGAAVEAMVRTPDFRRFAVTRGGERTLVDLVIDRAPQVVAEKPVVDGVRVDPIREIAVNKVCALSGRNAPRDLVDLREILRRGLSLAAILADAAKKDASADPATLAFVLGSAPRIVAAAVPAGHDPGELAAFRDALVADLRRLALPAETR
jgi:hypothetical protein